MFEEKQNKTKALQVRLTEEEKIALKKVAEDNNTTLSKFVKSALSDYLEKNK